MSNPKRIEREWQELAAQWLSPKASQLQRDEMRNAFFAGALVAANVFVEAANVQTADSEQALRDMNEELIEFGETLP